MIISLISNREKGSNLPLKTFARFAVEKLDIKLIIVSIWAYLSHTESHLTPWVLMFGSNCNLVVTRAAHNTLEPKLAWLESIDNNHKHDINTRHDDTDDD